MTSGLLHASPARGIKDIAEVRYTDPRCSRIMYRGFGSGDGSDPDGGTNADILFPEIFLHE